MSSGAASIDSIGAVTAEYPGIETGFSDHEPTAYVGNVKPKDLSDNSSDTTSRPSGKIYPTEETAILP